MKYAFRCRHCGHLETSIQAAESLHPNACAVCGHGVCFHPTTGVRTINKENWDILAELRPAELGKFGLKPSDVEVHIQWKSTKRGESKNISVTSADSFGNKDQC